MLHVAENIALFCWTQNTSGEWGELIKCLAGLIKIKDNFLQFAIHERRAMRQREMQAGAASDAQVAGEEYQPEPRVKRKNSVENLPFELAVRYPLLHAAVHFKDLNHTIGSYGEHKQVRYILDLWSLPADRIPQLDLAINHPAIREIPYFLGVFGYEFLQKKLGLQQTSMPNIEQINEVLTKNIKCELLKTFGCL